MPLQTSERVSRKMPHPLTGHSMDPEVDPNEKEGTAKKSLNAGFNPNDKEQATRKAGSELLMWMGIGLAVVFLGYFVVDSLPFQILKPAWQLSMVTRLLNSSFLALVGFLCFHLAAILNPANSLYHHRLENVRKWAFFAAIGFVLLIPLQGSATWRAYSDAKTTQQTLIKQASKRLAPIKQTIESATSVEDLQQKLSRLQGVSNPLTSQDLALPLDVVKKSIMININRSENLYVDRLASATGPTPVWTAIQSGTRTIIVSLGYFLAFAAGAQPPAQSRHTLLQIVKLRFQSLAGQRRKRSRKAA